MSISVAVVGATGNVGREILNILSDRKFPVSRIAALASRKSVGTEISFGDELLKVKDLETFDFKNWDVALFAIGSEATKQYATKAAKNGCTVIDNSSFFRYDVKVPLIVPEVNPLDIDNYKNKKGCCFNLSICFWCWERCYGRVMASNKRNICARSRGCAKKFYETNSI